VVDDPKKTIAALKKLLLVSIARAVYLSEENKQECRP